jgi:hypothetical protein
MELNAHDSFMLHTATLQQRMLKLELVNVDYSQAKSSAYTGEEHLHCNYVSLAHAHSDATI